MRIKVIPPVAVSTLFLIFALCTKPHQQFRPDNSAIAKIGWACHRTITSQQDSSGNYLEVITHSTKVSYPGISVPWLIGSIADLDSVHILFSSRQNSKPFTLLLWDGIGEMNSENRLEFSCIPTHGGIDTLRVDIGNNRRTPSGRELDLKRIKIAVLYTWGVDVPYAFCLYDIRCFYR